MKEIFLYGRHACISALKNGAREVGEVFLGRDDEQISTLAEQRKIKINRANKEFFFKKFANGSTGVVHQNIAIKTQPLEQPDENLLLNSARPIMVLDQVSDPHNIGAIMRSANAFGFAGVVTAKDSAPDETAVIVKTAAGAFENVAYVKVTNLSAFLKDAREFGYWSYGLAGEAEQNLAAQKFDAKTILVMGAEGKGIRKLVRENCDALVKIGMSENQESLNVSVAAGIAMSKIFNDVG